ncbi:MAG TPA: hypothetical protein VG937_03260 [Polyangiaceae bacterium]|jgi:hypothetical protein|nr:hypothetical protein [Polyangiaceae bacterium]
MQQSTLEILKDEEGSVAIGWASDDVLYARLSGGLSAEIGSAFALKLQSLCEQVPTLAYFSDASELSHYDLLARSSFVRVVLANRRKFASLVILTWPEGISPVTRNFVSVLGDPIEVLTDPAEFDAKLLRAAPHGKHRLDPRTWVQLPRTLTVRR